MDSIRRNTNSKHMDHETCFILSWKSAKYTLAFGLPKTYPVIVEMLPWWDTYNKPSTSHIRDRIYKCHARDHEKYWPALMILSFSSVYTIYILGVLVSVRFSVPMHAYVEPNRCHPPHDTWKVGLPCNTWQLIMDAWQSIKQFGDTSIFQ